MAYIRIRTGYRACLSCNGQTGRNCNRCHGKGEVPVYTSRPIPKDVAAARQSFGFMVAINHNNSQDKLDALRRRLAS